MEAAALAALGEASPPPELQQAWMCERYKSLPNPGGVNQQEYYTMHAMSALDNIYTTVSRLQNLRGHDIHRLTEGERRILGALRAEGIRVN